MKEGREKMNGMLAGAWDGVLALSLHDLAKMGDEYMMLRVLL